MGIRILMERCLSALEARGYSATTLRETRIRLNLFVAELEAQGIREIERLQENHLTDYQELLAWKTTKQGRLLQAAYRNKLLSVIRLFLKWLYENDWIVNNLSQKILFAKEPKKLPRHIPTKEEMVKILEAPDMTAPDGYRDRLMMELLYATGLRRQELLNLKVGDLESQGGYLYVREGKGAKDRVVPLGPGVCRLFCNYVDFVRPSLMGGRGGKDKDHDYLFSGQKGLTLSPSSLNRRIQYYALKAEIPKTITTHSFRHACATHMMQNGAPLRHVQELLGHASVNTTQIYVHVTINELKKAHKRYHPRERMKVQG